MSINIVQISPYRYTVNGKLIYTNIDGEWVTPSVELSIEEKKAFNRHLKAFKNPL